MKNIINIVKNLKNLNSKISEKLPTLILGILVIVVMYASVRDSIVNTIQLGSLIPNSIVNSVVVALDGTINPNGIIASAVEISKKVEEGEGIIVRDVFRRCKIQSENRVSDAYFQLYDTKAGINNGDPIAGGSGGSDLRKYLRYDNRSSLDLLASQYVVILMDSGNPSDVINAVKENNEAGFVPIIRLGVADLGTFPFILTENADQMVDYFTQVGDALMAENKGYRAVLSLGPNEPHTGDFATVMGSMGLTTADYQLMVQRQNQAADRLQKYRVVNGGVFWFGPSIFNGTETYFDPQTAREYSYDIYHHLYYPGDYSKNYFTRVNIDPDLFDVMLVNEYSVSAKTAYEFYRDYGLKEYVDSHANLVTVVTEFGTVDAAIVTEDLKDDFKALYDDPKIEGINYFRALKDKPSLPPAPTPEQSLAIEDVIKFTEQSNKTAKKISLKPSSWLNCELDAAIEKGSTSGSSGGSGVLNPTSKGGLNEGDNVGGGQGTMDKAASVGLKGYSLAIAYKPSDSGAAIQFIKDSISKGFIPIIRLCVDSGGEACGFNLSGGNSADLVTFYNAVAAGANGSFIGIVGPNEPKTEADAFNASVSDAIAASKNAIVNINKNGKMLAAPAAFNLQTDELDQYKTAFDTGNFDVLIGNAYNIGSETADGIASNAISYARSKGLKIILTETGTIAGTGAADFIQTVGSLCQKVDGFLLFRVLGGSQDGDYANKPTPYSDDQLRQIATACSGGSPSVLGADSTVLAIDDNGGDGTTNSTTDSTGGQCVGGIADENIVLVGDSLTQALSDINFTGVPDEFEIGEPGASTYWFMPGGQKGNEFSDKVKAAAANPNAKALFLMLGTNDCGGVNVEAFGSNLSAILGYIKDSGNPELQIYVSTIPNAREGCSADTINAYNSKIRSLATNGIKLREVGNFSSSDTTDGVHLTVAAYTRIANITRGLLGATNCPTGDTGSNPGSQTGSATNAGSIAVACGVEDDKPASFYQGKNAAALRVKCSGGSCTTKKVGTLEIEAPVKFFITNSPTGTMRLRTIPVSQVTASQSKDNNVLDALNMFAGGVKVGSKLYPIPGWGSAVNNSYQLLASTMTEGDVNRVIKSSNRAKASITENKLSIQLDKDSTVDVVGEGTSGLYSTNTFSIANEDSQLKSINERAVTYDGISFNDDAGLAEWRKNVFPYDPSIAYPSYIAPKACQSTKMKFINNLDNYVTGPEVVIESQTNVTTNTTSEICWMYAGRSLPDRNPKMSGDGVKTCGYIFDTRIFQNADISALSPKDGKPLRRVYQQVYDPISQTFITTSTIERGKWTCQELYTGQANPNDSVVEDAEFANAPVPEGKLLPDCDFDDYLFELNKGQIDPNIRSGRCNIPAEFKSCLRYDPQDSDEVYIHTESYPTINKVNIPGGYAALYGLYDRLQTIMSNRYMKFVFQENYGMKLKVSTKIRDANESINQVHYDFSEVYDSYSTLPELIDNSIPLASNNSTKTQFQYFDYLGYLDILQEYIVAYADEQVLIGDHIIDNPFINSGLNPLPGREKIVAGGFSNMSLANPILTCDQVEICKDFNYSQLEATYGAEMALALCPLAEKIPSDAKKNCITFEDDNRYIDSLKNTLCSRGYPVDENCNFQCSEGGGIGEGPIDNGGNEGNPPIEGKYEGTACPAADNAHRCFQGPYGAYTHLQSVGLPLDLYPAFTSSGADASKRDKRVVAPENGVVTSVENVSGQGYTLRMTGETGINYLFLHLNGNDSAMVRSGNVTGGQRIAEIATQASMPGLAYDDGNIHTHIRAEYNGQDIDPYYLFGQILGCHAKAPDDSWTYNQDITGLVSNPQAYCVKTSSIGGSYHYLLNDNHSSKASNSKPADSNTTPMSNAAVKQLFDQTYGNPRTSSPTGPVPTESFKRSSPVIRASANSTILASASLSNVISYIPNDDDPSTGDNGVVNSPEFKIRVPSDTLTNKTSSYGPRCFERNGTEYCDYHTGDDYAASGSNDGSGSPVLAGESGVVIDAGSDPLGYGNYVRILHPNGYSTLYGHNSSLSVREGDCVAIGQEIAKAGSTGNSTGTHIHLEVRKDGTCTIEDYSQGSTQDCAINPAPFVDPSKRNSSMFTEDEIKDVCSGKVPVGPNPGGGQDIVCLPGDENEDGDDSGSIFYKTVFDLMEKLEQVTGVSKYYLAAILSLESSPELNTSVGQAIQSGGATYTGDPYDVGNENPNGASAVGPFQFICRTAASYFFPPGGGDTVQWPVSNPTTTCSSWSNSKGRYYDRVLSCVQAIGMNYENGDILDPQYIGVGGCAAAIAFNGLSGKSLPDVNNSSSFGDSNPYWSAAGSYNGGGSWKSFPESVWYANSAWGRTAYFQRFWDEYKSGEKGADCSRPYREWYYYQVDLGIQCVSNGYGGQCTVNSASELDAACNR